MSTSPSEFGELLLDVGHELDPPPDMHARLNAEYARLGEFVQLDSPSRFRADAEIYPQGSKALGTLVKPIRAGEDFDLDAVYRRDIETSSTSQAQLKETMGEQLAAFVEARREEGVGVLLTPGRRCWTLEYDGFHVDVLPALPDAECSAADALLIADRDLREWQPSCPRGLASWFRERREAPFRGRRDGILEKSARVKVQPVVDERSKTPLQVAVQIMKRHRDICFEMSDSARPISVIITTLAGQAYGGELDPYEALATISRDAWSYVERDEDDRWRILNPAHSLENYADKWNEDVARPQAFERWLRQLGSDFADARAQPGRHKVAKALGRVLGEDIAHGAVRRSDSRRTADRRSGLLSTSSSGLIGHSGDTPLRDHTFYGTPEDA